MSDVPPGFEILLLLLPRSFRKQHREGMRQLLKDYADKRSRPARLLLWLRAALDVIWVAMVLRGRIVTRRVTVAFRSPAGGSGRVLDNTMQDLRYAFRSLRRDSALATLAIAIVGLGVGASAIVFSVVNTLLLKPLPFERPDQLVWISNGEWGRGQQLSALSVQVAHLQDLRAESEHLVDVAGYYLFDQPGDFTLTGRGAPERLNRLLVTANFFQLLGIIPVEGRLFSDEEVQFDGPRAVLLDHGFWVRRFGGDPGIVGRSIVLDDEPATVVGVLPAVFDFASIFWPDYSVDFVAPFPLTEETNRQGNTLALIGRMADGATLESTRAEATLIAARPRPDRRNGFAPFVVPLHERVTSGFEHAVLIIAGAVGLVMLIVCANLSNLLLARGTAREKEVAIRAALGASRGRLIRQMLTESLALASCGAVLGFVVAVGGTYLITRLDINVPLLSHVRVDGIVLAFTLVAAMATGMLFGVAPALRMSTLVPRDALREYARGVSDGKRQGWIRAVLVVTEVALACMLLVGAGLLMRSLVRLMEVDLGFQPERAIALRIDPSTRFTRGGPISFERFNERRLALLDEILLRVRQAPGVDAAGTTDVLPTGFNRRWSLQCEDPDVNGDGEAECRVVPFVRIVSEGYIEAMGLSLVAGRDFTRADNASAPNVVIINQQLADILWPEEDPLGKHASVPFRRGDWNVIGVVRGMRHLTPEQEPGPEVFFSFRQMGDYDAAHLIVRGQRSSEALAAAIRGTLSTLDASMPLTTIQPIQEIIDRSLSSRRFVAMLLTIFAAFAVVLASLGIYGVISYSVSRRRQEMGIRLALGASASHLHRRILGETGRLVATGLVVGLLGAQILASGMQGLLFGVQAFDAVTFVAAPIVLFSVAGIAGYLPARRATGLDPASVLRAES